MSVADGPQQPDPTQLEQFFGLAKAHLRRGPLRTTQSVAEIRAAMGRIPLEELGFTSKALQDPQLGMHYHGQNFSEGGPSHVTYLQIHEDLELTLGVFCFPPGASIPLHNHPGMTVLSRLLFGRLRVTAYDWVGPDTATARALRRRPARQVVDTTLVSPAEPLALFPSDGGNIHEFVAETACAVLDLLTPPYDAQNGRDCLYFKVSSEGSGEQGPGTASGPSAVHKAARSVERAGASSPVIVELEEHDPPDEFEVVRGDYCGVQLS